MDLTLLAALILLNGVFAMAEIALVTARKSRLQRLADAGDRAAATAVRLGEEPTQFLSTVQIGITAIGVLNGIVGEAALAGPLAALLQELGVGERASAAGATAIVVAGITYFTIVVGELVPKRLAQLDAEGIARRMARPIALLAQLSRPFVYLLSVSTDGILRLLGKGAVSSANLTEEDIHAMLAEGSRVGVIERHEHELVRNVFRLDDRMIASLMTPRSDIVYLDVAQPLDDNLQHALRSGHSRFPVCRGGLHDLLGVATAKRLLRQRIETGRIDLMRDLQACAYVPESLTGMQLLAHLRESGVQMVFVVDEYGEILGMITLQDMLDALAGEFPPRHPEEAWAVRREDGSWLLDGLIPVPVLKDRLGLKTVPDEDKGRYNTLSGMLMWLAGDVPRTGDVTDWEDWRFEVVDLDGNRVDKVLASRRPDLPAAAEPAPGEDA
ncbi:MAG: hemolysin family protein [Gammaproteobacteria bacterium]